MSQEHRIAIPRASDRKILQVFERLNTEFGKGGGWIRLLGQASELSLTNAEARPVLEAIREGNGSVVLSAHVATDGFSVRLERDEQRPAFDKITIGYHNNTNVAALPLAKRIQIIQQLINEFHAADPAQFATGEHSAISADIIARQQTQLDRLVEAHTEHMARMTERAASLQADYSQKIAAIDKEAADRRAELDSWHQDKELELAKEREAFEAHKKAFDDRGNTHVRRQLRTSLHDDIRETVAQFELSRPTRKLRLPVHVAAALAIGLLGLLLWRGSDSFLEAARAGNLASGVASLMAVKLAANALGLGAVVWFYLRFLARWSEKHANEEFQLRQLQFDVDRASWAVEAAFEWQQQKGEPMPAELLQSVTHGLFGASRTAGETELTAADQLASALLGSSTKVKLQAGGQEIEINPKLLAKKPAA